MRFKEKEQIREMYNLYNWKCFVTGNPVRERAHILGQGKTSRSKWGNDVIDNPLNWLPADGLDSNNLISIDSPVLQENVASIILTNQLTETEKRKMINNFVRENIKRKRGKYERHI